MKLIELELEGLDCASCAIKIEDKIKKLDFLEEVQFNFTNKKLRYKTQEEFENRSIDEVSKIVKDLEPHVEVINLDLEVYERVDLKLEGLDCASCAIKIEDQVRGLKGLEDPTLNFTSKNLSYRAKKDQKEALLKEVKSIVKDLEPHVIVKEEKQFEKLEMDSGHSHGEFDSKKDLFKIGLAGLVFVLPKLLGLEGSLRFLAYFSSYVIIGHDIIYQAWRNILAKRPFDEYFLMTVATLGAFFIGEYPEAVAVMLFYKLGEYFQSRAVNHSRKSISALLDIRPDYANLEKNGEIVRVGPGDVKKGDYIIIRPGEKVPLDGIVTSGESSLDTSNITGESLPRNIGPGDEILSGSVNNQGLLKVRVEKEYGESTVSKILDLVENASSKKADTENFITKFARYYTPVVVLLALLIAVLPPLILKEDFSQWIYNGAVFLVISCPCALVISIPLGFFGGIGGASKKGILIKGGNYLEALNYVDTIVFDKTGTITKGKFEVVKVYAYEGYSEEDIVRLAAHGEYYSTHPIGRSIVDYYSKEVNKDIIGDLEELPGKGVRVKVEGKDLLIGNRSLLEGESINTKDLNELGTLVYLGLGSKHIGSIIVGDVLKDNVIEDIKKIKAMGVSNLVMLSGDNQAIAEDIGARVGINQVYGDLLPQDKVSIFEDFLNNKKDGKKIAFVGDGVNDAPVIARADIGFAMGGLGSDAAIEASDIVIMTDELGKIATAIKVGRNTKKIVTQNIILALGVKAIILGLGAFGKASMWAAVFADVGVSIIAIFNSIRALKVED